MKQSIDRFIILFSYKNPKLWLEINEWIFDDIEDCKKKQKEKMYRNVQNLIRKFPYPNLHYGTCLKSAWSWKLKQ